MKREEGNPIQIGAVRNDSKSLAAVTDIQEQLLHLAFNGKKVPMKLKLGPAKCWSQGHCPFVKRPTFEWIVREKGTQTGRMKHREDESRLLP